MGELSVTLYKASGYVENLLVAQKQINSVFYLVVFSLSLFIYLDCYSTAVEPPPQSLLCSVRCDVRVLVQ